MHKIEEKYYQDGYDAQCWGYPLLDHAWGNPEHPKKYQKIYREGQVQAFIDGEAEIPWFVKIAWKLFRELKSGEITSLFINKSRKLPINEWLEAEEYPTKGFAFRPYWHCTSEPIAPHLKMKLASGEQRVWKKVIMVDYEENKRPENQGGMWYLVKRIKIL